MAHNSNQMGNTVVKEATPLYTDTTVSPAQKNQARQIWLHYYNDYLREHQVISEEKWRRMRRTIEQGSRTGHWKDA